VSTKIFVIVGEIPIAIRLRGCVIWGIDIIFMAVSHAGDTGLEIGASLFFCHW